MHSYYKALDIRLSHSHQNGEEALTQEYEVIVTEKPADAAGDVKSLRRKAKIG